MDEIGEKGCTHLMAFNQHPDELTFTRDKYDSYDNCQHKRIQ
jgi:hypothetical protein